MQHILVWQNYTNNDIHSKTIIGSKEYFDLKKEIFNCISSRRKRKFITLISYAKKNNNEPDFVYICEEALRYCVKFNRLSFAKILLKCAISTNDAFLDSAKMGRIKFLKLLYNYNVDIQKAINFSKMYKQEKTDKYLLNIKKRKRH